MAKSEKPLINIITRTSNRPNYFGDCYRSIANQTESDSLVHWTTSDDDETYKYLQNYDNIRIVQIVRPRRKNKQHFPYNKYLHEVMNMIDDGWIMVLDDDDALEGNDSIQRLRETMSQHDYDDQKVFIWRVKAPNDRVIPSDATFSSQQLDPEEVTNNCFCFHVKHREMIVFEARVNAEFNVLRTLSDCLKPVWIDQTITTINNTDVNGGQGNRADRQSTKTKISVKARNRNTVTDQTPVEPEPPSQAVAAKTDNKSPDEVEIIPLDQMSEYSNDSSVGSPDHHSVKSATSETTAQPNADQPTTEQPNDKQPTAVQPNQATVESDADSVATQSTAVFDEDGERIGGTESHSPPVGITAEQVSPGQTGTEVKNETEEARATESGEQEGNTGPEEPPVAQPLHCITKHAEVTQNTGEITSPLVDIIRESLKLREHGQELVTLVDQLRSLNTQLAECIEATRSQVDRSKDIVATPPVHERPRSMPSVDMAPTRSVSDNSVTTRSGNNVTFGKAEVMGGPHKYRVISDSSSDDSPVRPQKSGGILDHVFVLQSVRGDKTVTQLAEIFAAHSIGCDTIELKPKTRFNQVMTTLLTEAQQRGYRKIAIINGNEITLHSKFFDLLSRQLNEVNPEFHILFMCHKLGMPQLKEWARQDPDYDDYLFLYDDMKGKGEKAVKTHWKSYGAKEFRIPRITVDLSRGSIDNRWGVVLGEAGIRNMSEMLKAMTPGQLNSDSILTDYQRKYGHSYYCLPNLLIPRQPNAPGRLKKICNSNGWFHHFFEGGTKVQ